MAKNTMRKVSNSVFNVVADTKKMSSINLAILVVSVAIVVVLVILLVKRSKREGFALINLSEASWNTKGEDGVMGEAGPPGLQGPQGLEGSKGEVASQSQEEKDALYAYFRNETINKIINDKLVVKEDHEGEDKYFPVGTINMRTILSDGKIGFNADTIYNDGLNNRDYYFNVKYNKLSKNSYVKITYTIPFSGNHYYTGLMCRIYVNNAIKNRGDKTLISASSSQASSWHRSGNWTRASVKDITVIGIDYADEVGLREYSIKLTPGIHVSGWNNPDRRRNDFQYFTNRLHIQDGGFKDYKFNFISKASCTIEEIVIADKDKDEIKKSMNFIKGTV